MTPAHPLRAAIRTVLDLPPTQQATDAELVARLLSAKLEATDSTPQLRVWRTWAISVVHVAGGDLLALRAMSCEQLRLAVEGVPWLRGQK